MGTLNHAGSFLPGKNRSILREGKREGAGDGTWSLTDRGPRTVFLKLEYIKTAQKQRLFFVRAVYENIIK